MSLAQYGFPVRKTDFGRDAQLSGQVLTLAPQYNMQRHLCWARTDQFLENGAGNFTYLPFDLPPCPAGTVIRVTGVGSCSTSGAATGTLRVAVSADWNVTSPTILGTMAATPDGLATSQTGAFVLDIAVRNRSTTSGNAAFVGGSGAN